jgi:hypothetical protein
MADCESCESMKRLIDELKDKASVAAVILRQYVEGSGIPLERSVIARQLIETFEKLTEKRKCEHMETRAWAGLAGALECKGCGAVIDGRK